jgi:carbon-monoxide dehydrogenase small subunit
MNRTKQYIRLRVNGEEREVAVSPNRTLLEVLREELLLFGTKEACDDGACGVCTVLVDGKPMRSCLLLAVRMEGKEITTIEGIAQAGALHPIQQAFIDQGAIQCGFCTPGMILTAKALLDEKPEPSTYEIRRAISGNLCRCTGYNKIVDAIGSVAALAKGGR